MDSDRTPAVEEIIQLPAPQPTGTAAEKRQREEEEEETPADPALNPMWKTSLCSYFRRPESQCSHGAACRYAHGEAELRPRPDSTWDPTSHRAKKLLKTQSEAEAEAVSEPPSPPLDESSLDKCLIGLPKKWNSDSLHSFLNGKGIPYKTAKKKKGMNVGFVSFENAEQLKTIIKVLSEDTTHGRQIKVADAVRRSQGKKPSTEVFLDQSREKSAKSNSDNEDPMLPISSSLNENEDDIDKEECVLEGLASKAKSACDVVTPLAHVPYSDQLEQKKTTLQQTLKRLTRNARKACPDDVPLPEWILKAREISGLPCKLEGIIESPLINGYRNKCEFSVGYSLKGKRTVGFMLGNFREGVTAVVEPIGCPNVSRISREFALIFQEFLQSSVLPVWNRIDNTGFWRQFTVREGRNPDQDVVAVNPEKHIAEVMLIIQVCLSNADEEVMKTEFENMVQSLYQGATACSPPLPLTTVVIQDHKGISNAAPADCPLIRLPLPEVEGYSHTEKPSVTEARIHDYLCNLRFCISPTAFFQVNTLAAERLYSLAGAWVDLDSDTLLFDVCCGTGTIGLTLAHHVGMVVGIEMNESAVLDAQRNAEINGIKNCKFICGKAEDVMGPLLKEYLDVSQPCDMTRNVSKNNGKEVDDDVMNENYDGKKVHLNTCESELEGVASGASVGKIPDDGAKGSAKHESAVLESSFKSPERCTEETEECKDTEVEHFECEDTTQEGISGDKRGKSSSSIPQFKRVVAIVDPPRVGLHPIVIKALRTHPCLRKLVYISCNPESLVANAIELCTPTSDKIEKVKGHRGWRNMSCAGLARHRAKSMPNSEPFKPVRAMAVDLFPHTPHCELVMLLER